jgi:hypothetical protein
MRFNKTENLGFAEIFYEVLGSILKVLATKPFACSQSTGTKLIFQALLLSGG